MHVELAWEEEDRLLLTCSGQMGWDAQDDLVKKTAQALDGRDAPGVLLDLESVDLITSAGLGSLLALRKVIIESGGRMILACASPQIVRLFKTVGLDRHVPMADTLEDGRNLLARPA